MKVCTLLVLAAGLLVGLRTYGAEIVLSDFTALPPAVYGTWLNPENGKANLQILEAGGLEVFLPSTAKGGACEKALNLNLAADSVLELTVVVKPDNLAKAINILLEDADGVQAGWSLRISDLQVGAKDVLVTAPLQIPDFVNAKGEIKRVDLSRVVSWHVQGDFASDDPIHVVLERLVVRLKSH